MEEKRKKKKGKKMRRIGFVCIVESPYAHSLHRDQT